jgi:hypothetical protein
MQITRNVCKNTLLRSATRWNATKSGDSDQSVLVRLQRSNQSDVLQGVVAIGFMEDFHISFDY